MGSFLGQVAIYSPLFQQKCHGNAQVELSCMAIYNQEIRDFMVNGTSNGEEMPMPIMLPKSMDPRNADWRNVRTSPD
jgi:hypothetical protein